jgi:hypothetical protein
MIPAKIQNAPTDFGPRTTRKPSSCARVMRHGAFPFVALLAALILAAPAHSAFTAGPGLEPFPIQPGR